QAEDGIRDRNVTGVQTWLFRSIFGARPRQALICRSASHSLTTMWKRETDGQRSRDRPAAARSAEESARAVDAGGVRQQIHMGAEIGRASGREMEKRRLGRATDT